MKSFTFSRFCLWGALTAGVLVGCAEEANRIPSKYPTLPAKIVPLFLKDSVLERVDLASIDPVQVSNYALVANLNGTGDSTAPTPVREYMTKELNRHHLAADLLQSRKVAVVRVDGLIQPGARAGQWFDAYVNCLPGNNTTSLAGGTLFQTDLKPNGANPAIPGGGTPLVAGIVTGPIFVNPAYALNPSDNSVAARIGRRTGVIMDGAQVMEDRPLILRLRQPQRSLSRGLADRIGQYFQNQDVAEAMDEGVIKLLVPLSYNGDWEHFAGLVRHLYLNASPEFAALKARQLVDEALKPDAPLADISFAWEGLGPTALPFLQPLLSHSDPKVAFAAARAAAFLEDRAARQALLDMARTKNHPFALSAVQVLGALPDSPSINAGLRELLDSTENVVRLAAYQLLTKRKDSSIISTVVHDRFVLDVVKCQGPPLIFATRQGVPRIAVLALKAEIDTPLTFLTLSSRLSISAGPTDELLLIYYQSGELPQPIKMKSGVDAGELIARLGGEGSLGDNGLRFGYGEVVAIVQSLVDARKIVVPPTPESPGQPLSFVLQAAGAIGNEIDTAPIIPDGSRPQAETDGANAIDQARPDAPSEGNPAPKSP